MKALPFTPFISSFIKRLSLHDIFQYKKYYDFQFFVAPGFLISDCRHNTESQTYQTIDLLHYE